MMSANDKEGGDKKMNIAQIYRTDSIDQKF